MPSPEQSPLHAQVVVVGGGVAGVWVAYRLAQRGVRVVLLSADSSLPPVSRALSVGLIRRGFGGPAADWDPLLFADTSTTQDPSHAAMMARHLPEELSELSRLVSFSPFRHYLRPGDPSGPLHTGLGDHIVSAVLDRFDALGGVRVDGVLTDLVVDDGTCLGVRYMRDGQAASLACGDLVLASGGFCGLLLDGVGRHPGHLLGTYARHGGRLANLEQFGRFALGDLERKLPCYPFDFDAPPRLLCDGRDAVALDRSLRAHQGDLQDLMVFQDYWRAAQDVPHTAHSSRGAFPLGPIRAYSMGGIDVRGGGPARVHAVGECSYGLAVDAVSGKPIPSSLAQGGELARRLAERPRHQPYEIPPGDAVPAPDPLLRERVSHRLAEFQDGRFTVDRAARVARWCRAERGRLRDAGNALADEDVLILAEAYTRSTLARAESRGFYFRPDRPAPEARFAHRSTVAVYDAARDRVHVDVAPTGGGQVL